MKPFHKFIYPVVFSLSCFLSYWLLFAVLLKNAVIEGGFLGFLVGIVLSSGFVVYFFLIVIPIYCFVYSRKNLLNEKRKFIFTLYNSLVLTAFCLILFLVEKETHALTYSLLLFAWAELWSVLPLLLKKKNPPF